jgi:hypothetical protein
MSFIGRITTVAVLLVASHDCAQSKDSVPAATKGLDQSHAQWTEVLRARVKGDRFDYQGLKKDRAALDGYLRALESVKAPELESWKKKEQLAFWIDVYNAYTVKRIVDAYPIDSIKNLGSLFRSVWDQEFIPLGALVPDLKKDKLSFHDVENKILRDKFKDARIHAAINCASEGCPPLRNEAFVAEKLDKQLDDQVKRWLTDCSRNRIDKEKGVLELSKVFDWFKEDFEREAGSVQEWIAKYFPDDKSWFAEKKRTIEYMGYSWSLNDAR